MSKIEINHDSYNEPGHQASVELWAKKEMATLLNSRHFLTEYQLGLEEILGKSGGHQKRLEVVSLLMLKNVDSMRKQLHKLTDRAIRD